MIPRRPALGAALAVAASLAAAPAAPAATWLDPGQRTYVPVPAGLIEHTVYEFDYEGIQEARDGARLESWTSADRSRNLIVEPDGSVSSEDVTVGGEWRDWNRHQNVVTVRPLRTPGVPVTPNQRTRAAILREQVQAGWLKVEGQTTYAGRPAVVLVDGPEEPVAEWHSERVTVDAETYEELAAVQTSIGVDDAGRRHTSTVRRRLVVDEDLPLDGPAAGNLVFGEHPGATVRHVSGDEEVASAARKRAKRKAAARRAKRTRKATKRKQATRSTRARRAAR